MIDAIITIAGTDIPLDGYEMRRGDSVEVSVILSPTGTLTSPNFRLTAKKAIDNDDAIATFKKVTADMTILDPALPNRIDIKLTIAPADTELLTGDTDLLWDFQLSANSNAFVKTWPAKGYGKLKVLADVSRIRP